MRTRAFLSRTCTLSSAKTGYRYAVCSRQDQHVGFDCSGFVQWAYKSVRVSLRVPRAEQSVLVRLCDSDEMEAGDIVAFRHPAWVSYGYIRWDGKFIPAPARRENVEMPRSAILISVRRSSAPAA